MTSENGEKLNIPEPLIDGLSFDIVTAEWNSEITHALRDAAVETLKKVGISEDAIRLWSVPGAVELVNAAGRIVLNDDSDGVIILGCVIKGETPHFDYVCMHTTMGVAQLNADGGTPVTFGLLTVDNLQQAKDRAGGRLGNKGAEAACAAITMANFHVTINEEF